MIINRNSFVMLGLAPLAVFLAIAAGFSNFGLGRDYFSYLLVYEDIRLADSLDVVRFEPGFVFTTWVAKFILDLEFPIFLATLAGFALLVKFHLFSKHRRPILTTLFYLCCWYPVHEYTQIRAALALAFCLIAAEFFFRLHFIVFALTMAAAVSFHASALIVALVLPGAYILASFRLPLVILVIALSAVGLAAVNAFFFTIAAQFNTLVDAYVANGDSSKVNLFSGANLLTAGLLGSILFGRSLENRRDTTFFIVVLVGLATAVALQTTPVFSHRIKEMLLVFLVPLAFKGSLTRRSLPQYGIASALAGWSLYAAMSLGIIGGAA